MNFSVFQEIGIGRGLNRSASTASLIRKTAGPITGIRMIPRSLGAKVLKRKLAVT